MAHMVGHGDVEPTPRSRICASELKPRKAVMTMEATTRWILDNWMMHSDVAELGELAPVHSAAEQSLSVEVVVCLPFALIGPAAQQILELSIGGRDCHRFGQAREIA